MIADIKECDLIALEAIEQHCFSSTWNHEHFLYELQENPFSFLKGIFIEDTIIGYIDYWITFECCQLNKIAILPAYRGNGYACQLMDKMLEEAQKENCETVMLEVRFSNSAAQQLYKRYGFIELNIRKGYYTDNGEDAIIMGKAVGGN